MHYVAAILLLAQFVLSWMLEPTVNVPGSQYVGWAVWGPAIILLFVPMRILRAHGQVQRGKSYVHTETLVDSGLYALVRHPQYLGWMLMYLASPLFNPNWIVAVLGSVGIACVYWFTREEERLLITKFGEPYRRYMQSVPRFNLPAGIVRRLQIRGTART
ncbi:MAG: isoprenylcysteine carboxylmethyltransferase family protein [Anaerolineae bacterium]|jgi:protein-S-isoprenylcysteine O-methyltransferase Ste14